MIKAEFYLKNDILCGFSIKGHAEFNDYGLDVVCAAVTSAVELTSNAITEILMIPANVGVFEDEVRLLLPENFEGNKNAIDFIKALRLHIELLSQDYQQNVSVNDVDI